MKAFGFNNIKIYNGGIKDWKKSGLPLQTIDPLPDVDVKLITVQELLQKIKDAESADKGTGNMHPSLTILDLRTELNFQHTGTRPIIKSNCNTVFCLLDDLQDPQIRERIPKEGTVVTITETGNRDKYVVRYLSKFGYQNISGLLYGMRGWIKAGYPTAEFTDKNFK